MEKTAKYVYGVSNIDEKTFAIQGINDEKVYSIQHADISAIVSDAPFIELDPVDRNLLAHEKVIQHIMFDYDSTVAPMRFSTVLKNRESVEKLLQSGHSAFKENLQSIYGKAEFGLKAFFLYNKIQVTDPIKKSHEVANDIYTVLQTLALKSELKEQVTDDMILNAAFLLPKNAKPIFHKKILELDSKYGDFILFRPSGPTAPYHFIKMPDK